MNRALALLLLLLLASGTLIGTPAVRAQGTLTTTVVHDFVLNRYGYAVINDTVQYKNTGTAPVPVPDIQIGLGNLTGDVFSFGVNASGYSITNASEGGQQVFQISGGGRSVQPGATERFSFKAWVDGITSRVNNTIGVLLLDKPFISSSVSLLKTVIRMPDSTQFKVSPKNYAFAFNGLNVTYYNHYDNYSSSSAVTQLSQVKTYSGQDFHPLVVYSASRTISGDITGTPAVQDSISFKNDGTTSLSRLVVSPLTSSNGTVTVVASDQPPLRNPAPAVLSNNAIDFGKYLGEQVAAGDNFTITYHYELGSKFFNVSSSGVTIDIPKTPPIAAPVMSYSVKMQPRPGLTIVQAAPGDLGRALPTQTGTVHIAYQLTFGWALDSGVPLGALLFALTVSGLYIAGRRSKSEGEEESEEDQASDKVTSMIKAFEEKSGLITGLYQEITSADPNKLNKAFFDDLRSRLGAFRSRAMQRLNETRQTATSKRLLEGLTQLGESEREVDRAARDILNLYEQYYTNRMRKDIFEKLLPSYKKRLDRALDQLSDVLNSIQREAKLL